MKLRVEMLQYWSVVCAYTHPLKSKRLMLHSRREACQYRGFQLGGCWWSVVVHLQIMTRRGYIFHILLLHKQWYTQPIRPLDQL